MRALPAYSGLNQKQKSKCVLDELLLHNAPHFKPPVGHVRSPRAGTAPACRKRIRGKRGAGVIACWGPRIPAFYLCLVAIDLNPLCLT